MLLPIFLLALVAIIFLIFRLLSAAKCREPKSLTAIAAGALLIICFFDHLAGSVLGYLWVKRGLDAEVSVPVRADFPVWYFSDVRILERERSYGRPSITDPLYGVDLYFEEMIERGYSRIEVINSYDPTKRYELSLVTNAEFSGCQFYFDLPRTPTDTASKIEFRLERFTRDKLKKAKSTLVNGASARCIAVEPTKRNSISILEEYKISSLEAFGVRLQYRANRKLVDPVSGRNLVERREVWSDGGWFFRYVLANPESGTSGRGYRYGDAAGPLTIPEKPQLAITK